MSERGQFPEASRRSYLANAVIGAGYAVLGTGFIVYGSWRERAVRRAFERGQFAFPDSRVFGALTGLAVLLAVATFVLVVAEA